MDFRHTFLLIPGLLILALFATMPACVDDDSSSSSSGPENSEQADDDAAPDEDDDTDDADDDANDDLNDDTSNIDDDSDDDTDDDIDDDADDDLDDDAADDDDFDFGDVEITSSICNSISYLPQDECADALQPLYCFLEYPVYHERLYTHSEALAACREDLDPVWKDIRECSSVCLQYRIHSVDIISHPFAEFVYCLADRGWAGERSDLFDPNLWMPEGWGPGEGYFSYEIYHAMGFWSYTGFWLFGGGYYGYNLEIGGALTSVSDLAMQSHMTHVFSWGGANEYSSSYFRNGNATEIGEAKISILYNYRYDWEPGGYCEEGPCEHYERLLPVQ